MIAVVRRLRNSGLHKVMKFGPNSIWLGAAAVLLVAGAAAQNGRDQRMQRQEQRQERQQAQREQRGFQPPPRNSGGFGQQPASNQQLQQLQSDPAFRRLAPQQQDQMRERLQHFNSLTPEQQDRMLDRMEMREHLPPEQRQEENELARRYRGLPAGRQQAVKNAVSELSALPPQERQQQLSSPLFRSRFTDNEREIIGQALEMRPTQGRPQAGEPPELP